MQLIDFQPLVSCLLSLWILDRNVPLTLLLPSYLPGPYSVVPRIAPLCSSNRQTTDGPGRVPNLLNDQ